MHTHRFSCSLLRLPRRNDTPVAMNTSSKQTLVANPIKKKKKEPGILGEMTNSRKLNSEYTTLWCQEVTKCSTYIHPDGGMSRDTEAN